MKKVLVTGATGFIGRQSLSPLLARGYEVHAVTSRREPAGESPQVIWHSADLLDRRKVNTLLAKVATTHLLHFARYAAPGKYWTSPENLNWVQASLDLIRAFKKNGGSRLVAAGTCAEYQWGGFEPLSEFGTLAKPATLYGVCKHALQLMLAAYGAQEMLSVAWGRIFFLYGPHEHKSRLVASAIGSLLR